VYTDAELAYYPKDIDQKVRLAAFDWLARQVRIHGEFLPRELLAKGFELGGKRIPLVSPQGIFKPQILPEIPLTITTTPNSRYNDSAASEEIFTYRYRGTDPNHRDNIGLRGAMLRKTPLIYFLGAIPGKYLPLWPVYIVGDSPETLAFSVQISEPQSLRVNLGSTMQVAESAAEYSLTKSYALRSVKQRLHQGRFRERVLRAYREQCAFCRLRHLELLDAAHIVADTDPEGEPAVTNGISLCKLHHAAFDSNIVGVRPDYVIEVRQDVLDEEDGPMLKHGLVELNKKHIILPSPAKLSPDKLLLEKRYEEFRAVG
jgi:putative restriction endonuclease